MHVKKNAVVLAGTLLLALITAGPALAHFQLIYTPETALDKGEAIELRLVFTHPFEAGHTMDMGKPEQFFVVRKGQRKDLLKDLTPITWTSLTNSGKAYAAKAKVRGMGDNVFCLVPEPYLEQEEDCYIQQITKVIVNSAGLPTDWDAEIGLPAEIVPLDKPYALWTGNVFRGIVKRNGQPVPYAQIEVEYLNHPVLLDRNAFGKEAFAAAPQDAFVTLTIKANALGEFAFGLPREGWWGFCALGAGPQERYKGKELSQDAVIWVQARDMDQ